jgi:hypothetical protein
MSEHGMASDEPEEPGKEQPSARGDGGSGTEGALGGAPPDGVVVVGTAKHGGRDLARLVWDNAGRIGAAALLAIAVLSLLFLAVVGSSAALILLVVLVIGAAMVVVGGRIRA